jgi:hypothetical protein
MIYNSKIKNIVFIPDLDQAAKLSVDMAKIIK